MTAAKPVPLDRHYIDDTAVLTYQENVGRDVTLTHADVAAQATLLLPPRTDAAAAAERVSAALTLFQPGVGQIALTARERDAGYERATYECATRVPVDGWTGDEPIVTWRDWDDSCLDAVRLLMAEVQRAQATMR